jgi:hypothetical protein
MLTYVKVLKLLRTELDAVQALAAADRDAVETMTKAADEKKLKAAELSKESVC